MSTVNKNGISPFSVPALFDDFFSRELFNWESSNRSAIWTTVPSVNSIESGSGGLLNISGVKEQQSKQKDKGYICKEFSYESFQRSIELPRERVDEKGITACYQDGILRLNIPKKQEANQKASRMIAIH